MKCIMSWVRRLSLRWPIDGSAGSMHLTAPATDHNELIRTIFIIIIINRLFFLLFSEHNQHVVNDSLRSTSVFVTQRVNVSCYAMVENVWQNLVNPKCVALICSGQTQWFATGARSGQTCFLIVWRPDALWFLSKLDCNSFGTLLKIFFIRPT